MKVMDSCPGQGATRREGYCLRKVCNAAMGAKTRFHVSISPGCSTQVPEGSKEVLQKMVE